ncbi:hypothetical protein [Kribbella deserti]|uniref:DNA primase n=1 Tax=Kribbella deserti TaxID=1926257 RepID=A0ABV6QJA7_9ACTN
MPDLEEEIVERLDLLDDDDDGYDLIGSDGDDPPADPGGFDEDDLQRYDGGN